MHTNTCIHVCIHTHTHRHAHIYTHSLTVYPISKVNRLQVPGPIFQTLDAKPPFFAVCEPAELNVVFKTSFFSTQGGEFLEPCRVSQHPSFSSSSLSVFRLLLGNTNERTTLPNEACYINFITPDKEDGRFLFDLLCWSPMAHLQGENRMTP